MSEIISEIGINWSANLIKAKDMINASKEAGADYVKFQMFNEDIIKSSKYKEELADMILDYDKVRHLSLLARTEDIRFGVSVMYPGGFDILDNLDLNFIPDFIKIRETDKSNVDIARHAVKFCNKWNIPLLISTESYISEDDYFRYNLYHTKYAKYLYCVPKYPPELNEIHKDYICNEYFNGYSNHFPSKYLPMLAVAQNLEFIEVHTKKDDNCIDNEVSLTFSDLKEICDFRDILIKLEVCTS